MRSFFDFVRIAPHACLTFEVTTTTKTLSWGEPFLKVYCYNQYSVTTPHSEGDRSKLHTHLDLPLPQTSRPLSSAILRFMELTVYRANSKKQISWNTESLSPGVLHPECCAPPQEAYHLWPTTWSLGSTPGTSSRGGSEAPGVDLKLQGWI